jgi:hypothetical protein
VDAGPALRAVLSTRPYLARSRAPRHLASSSSSADGAPTDYPAERALRDVRTATLMSPTVDRMMETIGKHVLGLGAGMFNVGR